MADKPFNNTKLLILVGAMACTSGMLSQRVENIGVSIGCAIVAASLFACWTALHLHDLRSKDDE
jgi:hypothetical protein